MPHRSETRNNLGGGGGGGGVGGWVDDVEQVILGTVCQKIQYYLHLLGSLLMIIRSPERGCIIDAMTLISNQQLHPFPPV